MPEQLGAFAIQALIEPALPACSVTVLDEVGSTNQWLIDAQPSGTQDHFCLALQQRSARGRRGKGWESPLGNFYGSASLAIDASPSAVGPFSLAVACTVAETLEDAGVTGVRLKWPNDVQVDGRKIAGILLELPPVTPSLSHTHSTQRVVVGVGINVESMTADVGQPVASLREQLGDFTPSLATLAASLWSGLRAARTRFVAEGFAAFADSWHQRDALHGADVNVLQGATQWQGRVVGIAPDGSLRVERDGIETRVNAGEVSVRAA